ncbi:MAG: Ribulose-phosphate 3-epimerase [Chlamydiae bacterium]|nr:Ribulose-phosphate 3-epimerase [Chlamydiota bacterium]
MDIKIAPSMLSCDFAYLHDEVKKCEDAGADMLHLDVMDGHFVQNITIGPSFVTAVNRSTDLFLDVHLMIYNPFDYIERFVEAGADRITFHFEATEDVENILDYIRKCGVQAGLAFSPDTSVTFIPKYLTKCDSVLIMTVHPGFGGQKFIPEMLEKIELVSVFCQKNKIKAHGLVSEKGEPFSIEVDGGIDQDTIQGCVDRGANEFVSGSYLFKQKSMKEAIQKMKRLA